MAENPEDSGIPTASQEEADSSAVPSTPPRIEGYEILGELPRGGMGVVWRGRDTRLNRLVAIKSVSLRDATSDEQRVLQQEAGLAAQLRHPNIVAIYSFRRDTDPPCFIMEFVDGVPLREAGARMDYKRKAGIMAKVARAVAYAHGQGIIHRDLKPNNVMVDRAGEARVLDFGLARRHEPTKARSRSVKGTPLYMAPEQVLEPETVGPAADIYSLGLILFELITGTPPPPPAETTDAEAWARRVLPLPREINPAIPEPLQRICVNACEQRPEDRYLTAHHLAADLDRFVNDEPIAARPRQYSQLLDDRVRSTMDDLALWQSEGLITRHERDALEHSFARIAGSDSAWLPNARRIRWGPTIAHLGGWLFALSPLLWLAFYRSRLSQWERVGGIGLPMLLVVLMGALMWRRRRPLLGTIFCAVGAVLLPVSLAVFLAECRLLDWRQGAGYELLPPPLFCNAQMLAGLLVGLAYVMWMLWRTKLGIYAILAAAMAVLTYAALTLVIGLKVQLVERGHFAFVACWFLPIPVACYLLGHRCDRRRCEQVAVPIYVLGGLAVVAITATWAIDIPRSWLRIAGPSQRQLAMQLLFMGNALLYFVLGVVNDRSDSRLRRMWGRWFYWIVPFFFVIPLDRMEKPLREIGVRQMVAFTLDEAGIEAGPDAPSADEPSGRVPVERTNAAVYYTEILVFAACGLLVALAVVLQWRWYLFYGLGHITVQAVLFTDQHLRAYTSWPVAMMVVGMIVMLLGTGIELRWSRQAGAHRGAKRRRAART